MYRPCKSDKTMAKELSIKPASVRMALTRARQCAYQLLTKELTPSRSWWNGPGFVAFDRLLCLIFRGWIVPERRMVCIVYLHRKTDFSCINWQIDFIWKTCYSGIRQTVARINLLYSVSFYRWKQMCSIFHCFYRCFFAKNQEISVNRLHGGAGW